MLLVITGAAMDIVVFNAPAVGTGIAAVAIVLLYSMLSVMVSAGSASLMRVL